MSFRNYTIVSIEGNIGSGKSTLLEELRNTYQNNEKIAFVKEPVDEWETIKDENSNTMLQKFYGNQEKYAFSFQMMAYISRLNTLKTTIQNNPNAEIFITERCLYTDKYVFALMLYNEKKIEEVNFQIYNKWFEHFAGDYPINKMIYVNTDPSVCHNRIAMRSRAGESTISIDYLTECHNYHEQMVRDCLKKTQCLELDGNLNIHTDNTELFTKRLESIHNFISLKM